MATHSSVLAWRIPGTGEPRGLPSMGLHRVGHDWSNLAAGNYFSSFLLLLIKFTALFTWPVCPCKHLSCFVCRNFPLRFLYLHHQLLKLFRCSSLTDCVLQPGAFSWTVLPIFLPTPFFAPLGLSPTSTFSGILLTVPSDLPIQELYTY